MTQHNSLSTSNILLRNSLQEKIISLNEIIRPAFNFGIITKKDNPKEYFASSVLYKIYSLNISTENVLLANDIFLSVYLYRYVYELYLKVFYIFSGSSDEEILSRLNNFFKNRNLKITEYQKGINDCFIPPKLKEGHKEKYKTMSRIVHPNIESLNIHLNKTADEQFAFLVPTINLIIWHIIEIVRLFSNMKLLDFDKKIDQEKLVSLQCIQKLTANKKLRKQSYVYFLR